MQVKLPPLGEGADSGTVAGIFIKVGDSIRKDQPIIELESEKAVASIPSPSSGVVEKILVREGEEIKVGQAIVVLTESEEGGKEGGKPADDSDIGISPAGELVEKPSPRPDFPESPPKPLPPGIHPPASPSVRKLARSLGIDLRAITGTSRGGRIVLEDLREYITRLKQRAAESPGEAEQLRPPEARPVDFSHWGTVRKERLSGTRLAIAKKMTEAWRNIPHVTQFDQADITDLQRLRKIHAPFYKKKKGHLTLTPFVLKALVDCLKQFPVFRASLDLSTQELVYKEYFHVGVAVDTEHGLLVPVIRDVDKKNLFDLSVEVEELAAKARERKLTIDQMQGGTFTISNQGGIGGGQFTPIINSPEVAILGVGRGSEASVLHKQRVQKRNMLPLALSYDHRVIDGADAVRFLNAFIQYLQGFKDSEIRLKT